MKKLLILLVLLPLAGWGQTYVIVDSVICAHEVKSDTIAMLPIPVPGRYYVKQDWTPPVNGVRHGATRIICAPKGDIYGLGSLVKSNKRRSYSTNTGSDVVEVFRHGGLYIEEIELRHIDGIYINRDPDWEYHPSWDKAVSYRFKELK